MRGSAAFKSFLKFCAGFWRPHQDQHHLSISPGNCALTRWRPSLRIRVSDSVSGKASQNLRLFKWVSWKKSKLFSEFYKPSHCVLVCQISTAASKAFAEHGLEWVKHQTKRVEAPIFHAAFLQSIFPCLLCMRDFITPANITADYGPPMLFRNTCTRSEIWILKHETLSRLARQRRGGGAPAWGRDRLPAPEEGGLRRTVARPRQPPERSGPNGRHLLHKWVRASEDSYLNLCRR